MQQNQFNSGRKTASKILFIVVSLAVVAMLISAIASRSGYLKAQSDKPAGTGLSVGNLSGKEAQDWYSQGQQQLKQALAQKINNRRGAAKNIILFIGDGMGIATVTAARIKQGQKLGKKGEENSLSFEHFPATGLAKTYNTNQQTADSAGTMTAIMSGVKTKAGFIGIAPNVNRGDCYNSKGKELISAMDLAKQANMATAIVTTTRVTHATPAATYAKSPERDWEHITVTASQTINNKRRIIYCQDIASQLVNYAKGDGIDIVLGGGRRAFLPREESGRRIDGQNLIEKWQRQTGGIYVQNKTQLSAIDPTTGAKILGLFSNNHLHYEQQRIKKNSSQPSLSQMTEKALQILEYKNKPYFMMVEAGRIDHAHHASNAYHALNDTIEFSNAVAIASKIASKDTLIIVTADHSHVFSMGGYATRGNPILGKVVLNDAQGNAQTQAATDTKGNQYTALSYANGLGFANYPQANNADKRYKYPPYVGRAQLKNIDTTASGYHQEALVPLKWETHGGEDVAVYATGPGAHLLNGSYEQNYIFHVMEHAANLSRQ